MMDCTKEEMDDVTQDMISNDLADYVLVKCMLCGAHKTMTSLRAHTKSVHKVTITEYKEQFGQLVPVKRVMHRCGICKELVLLDSDQIASHLKSPGHSITHKNYNANYMQDSRDNKQNILKQLEPDESIIIKEEQVKLEAQLVNTGTCRKRKKVMPLLDYDQDAAYKVDMKTFDKTIFEKDDFNLPTTVKEEYDQLRNDSSEPEEANNRSRRIRKKVISIFDYDEEYSYQKAMKASLEEFKQKASVDLNDLKCMKKLSMKSQVTVKKTKLTDEQLTNGFVTVEEITFDKSDDKNVKLEPLSDSSGKCESEEVEKNITKHKLDGKIIKKCKICCYSTDRYSALCYCGEMC